MKDFDSIKMDGTAVEIDDIPVSVKTEQQ